MNSEISRLHEQKCDFMCPASLWIWEVLERQNYNQMIIPVLQVPRWRLGELQVLFYTSEYQQLRKNARIPIFGKLCIWDIAYLEYLYKGYKTKISLTQNLRNLGVSVERVWTKIIALFLSQLGIKWVKRPHSYPYTQTHIHHSQLHMFKDNPESLSCVMASFTKQKIPHSSYFASSNSFIISLRYGIKTPRSTFFYQDHSQCSWEKRCKMCADKTCLLDKKFKILRILLLMIFHHSSFSEKKKKSFQGKKMLLNSDLSDPNMNPNIFRLKNVFIK